MKVLCHPRARCSIAFDFEMVCVLLIDDAKLLSRTTKQIESSRKLHIWSKRNGTGWMNKIVEIKSVPIVRESGASADACVCIRYAVLCSPWHSAINYYVKLRRVSQKLWKAKNNNNNSKNNFMEIARDVHGKSQQWESCAGSERWTNWVTSQQIEQRIFSYSAH